MRRNERDMIKNVYWSSFTVPFILVQFKSNSIFLDRCLKNNQISNFVKMHHVGAELFHGGRGRNRQIRWS